MSGCGVGVLGIEVCCLVMDFVEVCVCGGEGEERRERLPGMEGGDEEGADSRGEGGGCDGGSGDEGLGRA